MSLTLVAGVLLWTFRIYTPPAKPSVEFVFRSGGSNPVWGDPSDCQPQGHWVYPLPTSQDGVWNRAFTAQCYPPNVDGNFSMLNTTQIVVTGFSSSTLLVADVNLTFICNGTILVQGSLSSMTWFPGSTFAPAPNAPHLGRCGTFNPNGMGTFSTLYNRLCIFVPIRENTNVLNAGDTFVLYIHNGGYPLDFSCVDNNLGLCRAPRVVTGSPVFDFDDYHGAPPWCFTNPGACTITITYTGTPSALLATIPVYSMVSTT